MARSAEIIWYDEGSPYFGNGISLFLKNKEVKHKDKAQCSFLSPLNPDKTRTIKQ
jgi:hypothetical protein